MITIFLGAPGTGKGTISSILKEKHGFIHLSTGDLMRQDIKHKTQLGLKIEGIIAAGNLVPDDLTNELLKEHLLKQKQNSKIILDGYPRSIHQALFLEKLIKENNLKLKNVLYFDAQKDLLVKRISGRLVCKNCGAVYNKFTMPPKHGNKCDVCGHELYSRPDDAADKVSVRLETYEKTTAPLVKHYKDLGLLKEINANKEIEDIVISVIENLK